VRLGCELEGSPAAGIGEAPRSLNCLDLRVRFVKAGKCLDKPNAELRALGIGGKGGVWVPSFVWAAWAVGVVGMVER